MKSRKTLNVQIISFYVYLAIPLSIIIFIIFTVIVYYELNNQSDDYLALVNKTIKYDIKLNSFVHNKATIDLMLKESRSIANKLKSLAKNNQINRIDTTMINMLLGTKENRTLSISGFAILNTQGTIILDSNDEAAVGKNYNIYKEEYPELYSFIRTALTKKEFFGTYKFKAPFEKTLHIKCSFSERIQDTPFYLFTSHYQSNFDTKLNSILNSDKENNLKYLHKNTKQYFRKSFLNAIIFIIIIIFVFFTISYWIAAKLAKRIAAPLEEIQNCLKKYKDGYFHTEIPECGCVETVNLVKEFNKLGTDLNTYMDKLENEITDRNLIEHEIKIAQNIQKSIIPHITDEFNNSNFSLYAKLVPSKIVAGDFFDFYFIDKEKTKLAFLISDGSGKNISAAFFMCIVKTITKMLCISGKFEPNEVLKKTNEFISKDNTEYMFATMFLGFYDLKTGDFKYANAGHLPTINITKNHTIEKFGILNNTVLGFYPEHKYNSGYRHIEHGETLILYTDGILEAESFEEEEYGEERFIKVLSENSTASPEVICRAVVDDVRKFQNNIFFDDLTILVFQRK